jgi:hypothetical protein
MNGALKKMSLSEEEKLRLFLFFETLMKIDQREGITSIAKINKKKRCAALKSTNGRK